MAYRGHKVIKVLRVQLVHVDHKVRREHSLLARLVPLALLDHRVQEAHKVLRVYKAPEVRKAHKDLQHLVLLDL